MARANAKTAAASAATRATGGTMEDETNQQPPGTSSCLQELDFTKLFKPKGLKDLMGRLEPNIVRIGFPLETCQALGTTSALWLDRLVRKCIPQETAATASTAQASSSSSLAAAQAVAASASASSARISSNDDRHRIITIDTIRAVVEQDESLHFLKEILDQVEEEMDKTGNTSTLATAAASSSHLLGTTKKATSTRKRAPTSKSATTTTTTSGKRKRAAQKKNDCNNDFDEDDCDVKSSAIVQEAAVAANTSTTQKEIVQDLDDYD